jgi:rubrerythrin
MHVSALHLLRTAALVESRAHLYSAYLSSVFAARGWQKTFEAWGAEEATHGQRLHAWLSVNDPTFDFDILLSRYLEAVPYHATTGESAYGSETRELLARCFVEAMAVTYYQAIGGKEPKAANVCRSLAAEEAKHFTMFRRMLCAVASVGVTETCMAVASRFSEFSDKQIIYASWLARGSPGEFSLGREAWVYRWHVLHVYRPANAQIVFRLMKQVVGRPKLSDARREV